ncbi:MAG: hypothetical protein RLZZ58_2250 [Pseudomonadota bacterium]
MAGLIGVRPITFVIITDRDRARRFYGDTLGLPLVSEDDFAQVYDLGGIMLRASPVKDFSPQGHTILGWPVDDIAAKVAELKARDVPFKTYPGMGQDANDIWTVPGGSTKVAWFSDPDGNVLSLTQF